MRLTFSQRKITILKNIMAFLLIIIGIIYALKAPTVYIEMEGHLNSVEYILRYSLISILSIGMAVCLKYGVIIKVSR